MRRKRCVMIRRHKKMEELRKAKEAAEFSVAARDQFLSVMSHEIRTPMNCIIGVLEILQTTHLTPEQNDHVELAKRSGLELVRLLDDILEVSKIEAGKIELVMSEFNLRSKIADVINLLSLQANEKEIKLTCVVDDDVPLDLWGDAGRLRQIITNLVSNAIKFTHKGFVSVRVSKDADDDKLVTLRFVVRDSGVGIAPDKLERIFEPFMQENGSTARMYGGTGLGLNISRRLIRLMGGAIGVESQKNKGSTFWFTVVFEKNTVATAASPVAKVFERVADGVCKHHILLADDDEKNQMIISKLLICYGYQVDPTGNGREALRALEKNDYALVLMDCIMPEMDGYEATAIIRDSKSAVRQHDIPVIALTGNASKQDLEKCRTAGMNDHLAKPVILEELLKKLEKWAS